MRATVRTHIVLSHLTPNESITVVNTCSGNNNNNTKCTTTSCGCPYVDSIRKRESEHSTTVNDRRPVRVLITGAAGQIAYSLLPMVASGKMFGPHQKIILHLLDIEPAKTVLDGVVLELEDCAFPLLAGIVATTDLKTAFTDVDYALLIGSFPRKEGMERKELLSRNIAIFRTQGQALNSFSSPSVKVLVVGNPANTNCLIAQRFAPRIPKSNFSALTRLDANRAKSQIASKLKVPVDSVNNVIIWGNHSSTQYPDIRYAYVDSNSGNNVNSGNSGNSGSSSSSHRERVVRSVRSEVNDDKWTREQFVKEVQQRGAKVIGMRKLSSAASAANAIVEHMRDWELGTEREGEMVSMGVWSDGSSYGVEEGLIFSFPVVCARGGEQRGRYRIVKDLKMDEESVRMMKATEKELVEERNLALEVLKASENSQKSK